MPASASFKQLFKLSRYARGVHRRWPELVDDSVDLAQAFAPDGAASELRSALTRRADEAAILQGLRLFRHRQLFAIAYRDIELGVGLDTTLADLSALADVCVQATIERAAQQLGNTFGSPRGEDEEIVQPVIFGLGKLGGRELNFSSDIDLVMGFTAAGQTDGRRKISNEEYFAKLVGLITPWLAKVTADGFVYRVDWRLRPFGEVGRPALSFVAMENYFQRDGRDWERYAWIKARPMAGDIAAGETFLETLRPFVYPRYLDYTAFDALRSMKAMIRAEVNRKELHDDIKLGPGGIREIEFIAQAFQLIRGGREAQLRDRRLLTTLDALREHRQLQPDAVEQLQRAYRFLRMLENRLQQYDDQQTHRLPDDAALLDAIAESLGFVDWPEAAGELTQHRAAVTTQFDAVFALATAPDQARWDERWQAAYQGDDGAQDWPQGELREALIKLAASVQRSLGDRARKRLDRFVPRLLQACAEHSDPDAALSHALQVVRKVVTRSAYLALLTERPATLVRLVDLCAKSPWLTDLLADQPVLLDQLLDPRLFEQIATADEVGTVCEERLKSCVGDLEREMTVLREIKQRFALTLAAARLDQRIDPPTIAQRLAELAEAILQQAYLIAWRDMVTRHGEPSGPAPQFALIGYGSLGSQELNFGSDLDLVFLYDGIKPHAATMGGESQKSIINEQFLARVAQRIVHMLNTQLHAGRLYEVDTRLRPNGNSGLLVSSLSAFADYQRDDAWTWELLALTRARWVAGSPTLQAPFEAVRESSLRHPREAAKITADTLDMRLKMRDLLDRSDAERFDLKQGVGGKADIEFLAQLWRLRGDATTLDTPTITVLQQQSPDLINPYLAYLELVQDAALGRSDYLVPLAAVKANREIVNRVWDSTFGGG